MFIPDPGSDFFPSRIRTVSIPDPGSASKNLRVLTPKKWVLSSRKYDPGCSSRIPDSDADFYPSRIPDPGVKKAPDPGSATLHFCLSGANTVNLKRPDGFFYHSAVQGDFFTSVSDLGLVGYIFSFDIAINFTGNTSKIVWGSLET
jgi:hypothetical protein